MIVTTLGNTISEAITTFSVTVSIDAIRPNTPRAFRKVRVLSFWCPISGAYQRNRR